MITDIEIKNFRCFDNTKISGFGQVTLIGGQNNIGKTVLLEAIDIAGWPSYRTVTKLMAFRSRTLVTATKYPDRMWIDFFRNQSATDAVEITLHNGTELISRVQLKADTSVAGLITFVGENEEYSHRGDVVDFIKHLTSMDSVASTLKIYCETPNHSSDDPISFVTASSQGVMGNDLKPPDVRRVIFIPALGRLSNEQLAEAFDKVDFIGEATEVLNAVKLMDSSIEQVKTFRIGEFALYLKPAYRDWIPVYLFGDATSRFVEIVVLLLNNKASVVLLDEIENGMHYTIHEDVWRMLFRLAKQLDVQIFATTHSLEMIKAFQAVGPEYADEVSGAYIELTRNIRTHKIVGIKHEFDILAYELDHDKGKGLRGE